MRRALLLFSALLLASLLSGCKTGSIKGKVINPFNGKPVKNAIVQLLNTHLTDTTGEDGLFEITEAELTEGQIRVGKHLWSKSIANIKLSENKLEEKVDLFLYPRKDPRTKKKLKPGLFLANVDTGMVKILNRWISYEAKCKDGAFAYTPTFTNQKTKKKHMLPEGASVSPESSFLFYQATSSTQPVTASFISMKKQSVKGKPCEGFRKRDRRALFAQKGKSTELAVKYMSDGMFRLEGPLTKGIHILRLQQKDKVLANYLIEVL